MPRYSSDMFSNRRLEQQLDRVERKLDAIMRHLQIADIPASHPISQARPVPEGFPATQIDDLLAQGKKIQAIKVYRETFPGVSLKDAKDAVEERERRYY